MNKEKLREGFSSMNQSFLDSSALIIFFILISTVLASLYVRERIKNNG